MSAADEMDEGRLVDWLLGEVSAEQAEAMGREAALDRDVAGRAAELRGLFADLREIGVAPTGRVGVALRTAVERRLVLRNRSRGTSPSARIVWLMRVAAVAMISLGILSFGRWLWISHADGDPVHIAGLLPRPHEARRAPAVEPEVVRSESQATVVPRYWLDDRIMRAFYGALTQSEAAPSETWLCATNDLAALRLEFQGRFNPTRRMAAIHAAGASDYLEHRIQTLGDEIAGKIEIEMLQGTASPSDVALALRALLAAGSSRRLGPHSRAVQRCGEFLAQRVDRLEGGVLASALAGLVDVAVVSPRGTARLVGRNTARMVRALLDDGDGKTRPDLLQWNTPAAQVADAGRVLRLAPAFGVDVEAATKARAYLAAYLAKRVSFSTEERPDLLAAQLYGFGDLIDRAPIERKLRLWHASDLVPNYFVALHHISWSRFPLRAGWAAFQRELRSVAATATPAEVGDAAALLLSLAVYYAAPGCQELLAMASR
ncbi:MAG: hypothetical protein H6836_02905 [Planctomycetes bacterium]|nr:hypothetical protein [Planctomycetota bacterium]MCB9888501.1 hypothetical protein [Planctomycetota bacterium]